MLSGERVITPSGFPATFLWGTATAAYQIEGSPLADGKGESIWDRFTHTPGKIARGETGDTADNHYQLWPGDLDLMQRLNLNAYRFSFSWPRIFPNGYGRANETGLDFYSRLVDGMLQRGIEPFATLYHWDLPQALQDKGGWANRDTAKAFADLAAVLARRFGDRVSHWITHNEPGVTSVLGHVTGEMAPGERNPALILPVTHHLLLSHGLAVQAIRAESPRPVEAGITLNLSVVEPASDREDDVMAARVFSGAWQDIFLEALYHQAYPEELLTVLRMLGAPDDLIQPNDMATIAAPTDFLGVNYYTRNIVRAGRDGSVLPEVVNPGGALTEMGWEVYPQGLRDLLIHVHQTYKPARIYVTENGAAYPDTLLPDGSVHDPDRIRYLQLHFDATREAIAAGAPVDGFFVWSFMDNFEWAQGYRPRFGVVYVDYTTQERHIKDSGRFLAEVAATNGARLDEE
ncbi:MAG TPA: GH1 family beta-glucosidase [Ktedonobacterales bacterium]|jgi:beta-glucosidase|nr:GH1 family beta-glucosidase [Ktedonobacterales bacterium]